MNTVDDHTHLATLPNGVRVLVMRTPQRRTLELSVFVHSGSQHESARDNGISHVVEHMAFKGSATRDCQRINLDAEMLGAQVNAHTDKDHSAFHMSGLVDDAPALLRMLADIVLTPTFPADELERERQVILHEFVEDDDDPLSVAFRWFDKASWGAHALALPVIGSKRNIERFGRDELLAYVQRQYTGANLIVAVAADVDPERIVREAQDCFGALPHGTENTVAAPHWVGGLASRALAGTPQTHAVLGFPIPGLAGSSAPAVVAATLLGDGMSSPLMDELRERRGLVYYAACSADVLEPAGQFVIEASTSPQRLDEFFEQTVRLLLMHADRVDALQLQRARRQLVVRHLRRQDQPAQRLEAAALDLFATGSVRRSDYKLAELQAVGVDEVRGAFAGMLRAGASVAVAGKLARGAAERLRALAHPILRADGVPARPARPAPGRRRHFGARSGRA